MQLLVTDIKYSQLSYYFERKKCHDLLGDISTAFYHLNY